ncbi:energy transducer TonB [Tenacibaculum sp.]|nr:energy transducer TonB [Tenacibaculum sp.]
MKAQKKVPKKQLEKFSTVFTQLGLVLTLFVVYVVLEHKSEEKNYIEPGDRTSEVYRLDDPSTIFRKEVVQTKVNEPKAPKVSNAIDDIKVVDDNHTVKTTLIATPTDEPQELNIETLTVIDEGDGIDDKEDPTPVIFKLLEEAPVFRGCEGLDKKDNKKCFEKKLTRFVQRYFNGDLAQEVGLSAGKYSIYAKFIINKNGYIEDVKIRAPHSRLKKETQRIVGKLPKFTPGKQQGKPVNVSYTLPIGFKVE